MLGLKRSRDNEVLAPDIKKPRTWYPDVSDLPESAAGHSQTLYYHAPILTAIDTSGDGYRTNNLRPTTANQSPGASNRRLLAPGLDSALNSVMTNPRSHIVSRDGRSPWSTSIHRDEDIRFSSRLHDPDHRSPNIGTPTASLGMTAAVDQAINTNCMGDMDVQSEKSIVPPPLRLSSPIGNDIMDLDGEEQTSDGTNKIPKQSTKPVPKITMGYRADCEKCRCRVPGHYIHIRL